MSIITGTVFVLGNNIDTDQILPGSYIKINPSTKEGFAELGCHAFSGLTEELFNNFSRSDQNKHTFVLAGENFGCGSSREHAVIALQSAGIKAIIASNFARIFFRNCVSTGGVLPATLQNLQISEFSNNDTLELDTTKETLTNKNTNKVYALDKMGEISNIINSGGMFAYAKKLGKINNNLINHKNEGQ